MESFWDYALRTVSTDPVLWAVLLGIVLYCAILIWACVTNGDGWGDE